MPDPRKLYVCRFEVEMVVYAEDVRQAMQIVRANYNEPTFNVACDLVESDVSEIDELQYIPYDWRDAFPYTSGNFSPDGRRPEDEELTCQQIMEQTEKGA